MPIILNRDVKYVKITKNEMVIDAHWNYFETIKDALEYIDTLVPSPAYGVVEIHKIMWNIEPLTSAKR